MDQMGQDWGNDDLSLLGRIRDGKSAYFSENM